MFAIVADDGATSTRHFLFAAISYAVAILLFIILYRARGLLNWRGGIRASWATKVLFVALFLICGTVSLGSGLGWSFAVQHGDTIEFVTVGLVLIVGVCDRFIHHRGY